MKFDDFPDLPDGHVGVYDLEFAHLHGRRHYDAAHLHGTIAIPFGAIDAAQALLRHYIAASRLSPEELAVGLLPVLTEAALAELYGGHLDDSAERQERARASLARYLDGWSTR